MRLLRIFGITAALLLSAALPAAAQTANSLGQTQIITPVIGTGAYSANQCIGVQPGGSAAGSAIIAVPLGTISPPLSYGTPLPSTGALTQTFHSDFSADPTCSQIGNNLFWPNQPTPDTTHKWFIGGSGTTHSCASGNLVVTQTDLGGGVYGNFQINKVTAEVDGARVAIKETAMDDSSGGGAQGPGKKYVQLWIVDVSREDAGQRLPRQMVLIPEKPIRGGTTLRFTIEQRSEAGKQGLGNFRLSATSSAKPKRIVEVSAKLRPALKIAPAAREKQQAEQLATRYHDKAEELAPLRKKIEGLQAQIRALGVPTVLIAAENPEVSHPTSNIRIRGSFLNKGDEVSADIPSFLGKLPDTEKNRLGLAQWIVSRENPLTARVIVNHIWETYFGRGLVETVEDFGTQGTLPSHQDLLDYLAVTFMESGWDLKALHRTIVASATYRQSPAASKELIEKDPANILLSRGARFRVEAETVRDVALAASGLLSGKIGGPSVMPPQPEGVWEIPYSSDSDVWTVSPGEDKYRRGLYTFNRRTAPYPAMTTFDATSREYCTARRNHTDTPLQALTTLNDPAFFEAAQAMAKRILREGGTTPTARVTYGFLLATSRHPKGSETDLMLSALEKERRYFAEHLAEAKSLAGTQDPELAAWTMLSRGLLNLDETLTRQ